MKIVVLDGYTLNPGDLSWNRLSELGELYVYDRTDPGQTIDRIGDAKIVLTNKTPLSEEVFKACSMDYVGVLATGYNIVDIKSADNYHVTVTNIPTYGTYAVAQFTIGLLLEICHHIGSHSDSVKAGKWQNNADWCYWDYPLIELAGKTMGLVGFGKIGRLVGEIAKALGMKVIFYDRIKTSEDAWCRQVELHELFACSDVISLHCPLFDSTKNMINKDSIKDMKDGVIILNTSRGQLIVEQDLCDALEKGKVAYAAVDVVSTEPIGPQNPLLKAKNCLITPHIAWAPRESRQRLMDIAVDNVKSFIEGISVNVVNRP